MHTVRVCGRFAARAVFLVLVALAASLAPVAALPFVYVAQAWRAKEIAALVVTERR